MPSQWTMQGSHKEAEIEDLLQEIARLKLRLSRIERRSLRTDDDKGISDYQISSTPPSTEFKFEEFEEPLLNSPSLPVYDEPVYDVYDDDDIFVGVLDLDQPVFDKVLGIDTLVNDDMRMIDPFSVESNLVFEECHLKDYTGKHVTAKNPYAVILGDKSAIEGGSGNLVDSKPNDRIFIFYSDHGGPGGCSVELADLGMPNVSFIYTKDFMDILKKKHESNGFKKMVIYVESCESDSLFEGLIPDNLGIYITSASNSIERTGEHIAQG